MTSFKTSFSSRLNRLSVSGFFLVLLLAIGTSPVLGQDNGSQQQNTQELKKQLQQSYKAGAKAGNEGNFETAVAHFEEAIQYAQELELDDIVQKIEDNILSSLKSAGSKDLKQENYSEALDHFDKALERTEQDAGVYHNRGLALLNLDRTEEGLESLQTAIEVGNRTGNTRIANLATERIRDEFKAKASQALNAENPSRTQINTALEAIDQLEQYVDADAQSFYYRARAQFENGQYQTAIQTARQGLNMHQGSRSDAAKFYFVIGESQMRTQNVQQACQTFQQAAYGDYKARSEHYLENDCEDV